MDCNWDRHDDLFYNFIHDQENIYIKCILTTAQVSPTLCYGSLPLAAWISGFGTTFGWLQDVLFTHVQGVVIL